MKLGSHFTKNMESRSRAVSFCPSTLPFRVNSSKIAAKGRTHPTCQLLSRRQAMKAILFVSVLPRRLYAALEYPELRGLDEKPQGSPFYMQDGVKIQEVTSGAGDETVRPGNVVSVKYVLRRSNGYFIDASYGFDRFENYSFRAGSGQVIEGFDRAVKGMRIGARRRFVVPPELGYVNGVKGPGPVPPDFGAKRSLASHAKEPLVFEVQVVKIRE